MAYGFHKILKSLLITEAGTLTPIELQITPGGSASTKTTIVGSQTANRTITIPDATDTLIGKDTTDTLTNKTLGTTNVITVFDNNFTIKDGGTGRGFKFQASGLAGADRTITVFDADDTLVGKATTDTFTNKTFDAEGTGNVLSNITNTHIKASAAIAFSKLASLSSGNILVGNVSNVAASVAMSGDITISNAGVTAIGTNKVTDGMIRQSAGVSVIGRAGSTTGDVTDITASADNRVLKRTSGSLGFASIVNADIDSAAAIAYSKLNLSGSIVNSDIGASAAIAYSKLNLATSIVNADVSASAAIDFSKLASLTSGNILVGNVSNVAASVAMSGDITISNAGVTAIGTNKVTNGMIRQSAGVSIVGRSANTTGDVADITASADNRVLKRSSGSLSFASVVNADIDSAAAIALSKLATVTASRALVSDGSGNISPATTTSTEIGYVNGVTSAIQTQLDAKQARSTLTTKGDIYVATASATVARQAIGTNGKRLIAESSLTNGLYWAYGGVSSRTATASILAGDDLVEVGTGGGAATMTLPLALDSTGKFVTVTKTTSDDNAVTVQRDGTDTVNGANTFVLRGQYDSATFSANGSSKWNLVAYYFPRTVVSSTSSQKTPVASGHFHSYSSNNSVSITPGVWDLECAAVFDASGSANYTDARVFLTGANGADTGSLPATALSAVSGLTINGAVNGNYPGGQIQKCSSNNFLILSGGTVRVTATTSATIYVGTYAEMGTAANARINAYITAKRVG